MFGLDLLARPNGRRSRGRRLLLPGQGEGASVVVMKPVSVLVLVQVLGSVSSQPEQRCPAPCECSEAAKTVKCVNKGLSELPLDLPPYVRNLIITGNSIGRMLPRDGAPPPLANLSQLAAINLSNNHLQVLDPLVFADLPSLRQLDLSSNSLQHLSSLAFGTGDSQLSSLNLSSALYNQSFIPQVAAMLQSGALASLSHLVLDNNQLLYLPKGMFGALPSLTHLSLRNNYLVGLQAGIFKNLSQLSELDLSNNSLRRLWNSTLWDLPAQGSLRLYLGNNAWVCDCEIEDLVTWLKDTTLVPDKQQLLCTDPEEMINLQLVNINVSDLKCSDPDNLTGLQTSYVFLGIVLALIGLIFLLVLYLNRKGIKKWIYNIRDACRDHMEGYHYRYEINADPRLTHLSSNLDV